MIAGGGYKVAQFDIEERLWEKASWYASQQTVCHILENNDYKDYPYQGFSKRIAIGSLQHLKVHKAEAGVFQALQDYFEVTKGPLYGYLGYDMKNGVEQLESNNIDYLEWPESLFFIPKTILYFEGNTLTIESVEEPSSIFFTIKQQLVPHRTFKKKELKALYQPSKEAYIKSVRRLKKHLQRGDIYEVNLCNTSVYKGEISPFHSYQELKKTNPSPFSSFFRFEHRYIISASPERFLKRSGNKIISQPIKGTAPVTQPPEQLLNSRKEKAENIMVTDLVRNDMSKIAEAGSVKVEELCALYSFPKVHQLITTIVGEVLGQKSFPIIEQLFPMGSMTGAPKVRAMQLIEEVEDFKRGTFSAALGYIDQDNDFDFSVMIRSLYYDAQKQHLQLASGSAITHYAQAESEWEECQLKLFKLKNVLF